MANYNELDTLTRQMYRDGLMVSSAKSDLNLTDRDIAVIDQIALFRTNEEIGSILHMAPSSVRNCMTDIYQKIGVQNRIKAIQWAIAHGFSTTSPREVKECKESKDDLGGYKADLGG